MVVSAGSHEVDRVMVIYYVDVANPPSSKKWNKKKVHVAYDGERCLKVESLMELEDAEEIYIDALLPSIRDEVYDLLSNGVKVCLLRNGRLLKKKREENALRKSDEADTKVL